VDCLGHTMLGMRLLSMLACACMCVVATQGVLGAKVGRYNALGDTPQMVCCVGLNNVCM
jgi:hypothetical protein